MPVGIMTRRWLVLLLVLVWMAGCTSGKLELAELTDGIGAAGEKVTGTYRTTAPSAFAAVSSPRFADRDPHDWDGHSPFHYDIHGADVSKFQGPIDWEKVRANGISFVFIKATEGGDRLDDYFRHNWSSAKAARIPRGAYHFFYFCRPAFEQARWFIRNVPRDQTALPPVLDMEWNPHSPTCTFRPKPKAVRKEMSVFLSQVERHFGKKPIIYTTIDFFRDNELHKLKGYPYWVRSVAGDPHEKYDRHPWLFWQYTGTGIVPGIDGDADINVFNGDTESWREWLADNTE